jgi:hypothetical protein
MANNLQHKPETEDESASGPVLRARCSADLLARVQALARKRSVKDAEIIRTAVVEYLEEKEGGPPPRPPIKPKAKEVKLSPKHAS